MANESPATVRALFRLAAGSRLGFGHLIRGRALARALAIERPCLALRGGATARRAATRLGVRLVHGAPLDALRLVGPDVLIIDDPSRAAALPWCRAARRLDLAVVSIHDVGLALCGADLAIDGSIVRSGSPRRGLLSGPAYAILASSIHEAKGAPRDPGSILIALGGGPRLGLAFKMAEALRDARVELRIRIAGGLGADVASSRDGVECLGPLDGLAGELARCAVAITGGGMSLYEAAALDTPVVAWPVVDGQHRTVLGFRRAGLAAAVLPGKRRMIRLVDSVLAALADTTPRRTSATVDGLGAGRVAEAIRSLVLRGSREAA